jgi:adenylosuccinate lyase
MADLRALSVLDGRYVDKVEILRDIFSEYGLMKYRLLSEIQWLKFILKELNVASFQESDMEVIDSLYEEFSCDQCERVKEIEQTTNHDVKALEYYIKEELEKKRLGGLKEWVHFACTSEDINNTAYALMLKNGTRILEEQYSALLGQLEQKAIKYKAVPMLSRTHGQPASPTTLGKEFINFAWRIKHEKANLKRIPFLAKMNGATGNFNAHHFVYPEIDWIDASQKFVSEYLQLTPLLFTTQINPNAYISELLHSLIRLSSIIIDLDRDMWGYISLGYFGQKLKEGEVGSSTMPHKVNPIDFENSEGNLGIAIALMEHIAVKLQNSRFQRDLSDSTVLRNLGALYGYLLISLLSTLKGLDKLELNLSVVEDDLAANFELLAEPIQTMMRVYKEDQPYEKLKELTRGTEVDQQQLHAFIEKLRAVDAKGKERMRQLTPQNYIGLATQLVDAYFRS